MAIGRRPLNIHRRKATSNADKPHPTPNSSYNAEMAFIGIPDADSSYYCSQDGVSYGWLAYDFQIPIAISKYDMENLNGHGNTFSPVSWTLEGSLDGISWELLDTRSGHDSWNDGEIKEFFISHARK